MSLRGMQCGELVVGDRNDTDGEDSVGYQHPKRLFYNFETACTSRMPWKMRSLQLLCSLKVHLNKSNHRTAHFSHRINVGREGNGAFFILSIIS
jgi:hypothetical protein